MVTVTNARGERFSFDIENGFVRGAVDYEIVDINGMSIEEALSWLSERGYRGVSRGKEEQMKENLTKEEAGKTGVIAALVAWFCAIFALWYFAGFGFFLLAVAASAFFVYYAMYSYIKKIKHE